VQAQAVDLDLDGWADVVGLSAQAPRRPVWLHNQGDGKRFRDERESLGADVAWPKDLVAVAVTDVNGDGFPDLLVWSESEGLQVHANQGNGNHALKLRITGVKLMDKYRTNADGFGARVIVQAGSLWTEVENVTQSAGLGQSSQPLLLGIGKHPEADTVRIHWTDNVIQAEFPKETGGRCIDIIEFDRRIDSCPLLFTWDGQRWRFITDCLGGGSVGDLSEGGVTGTPRPEESLKIEADQLVVKDGEYVLKVAEAMQEVTYLDRLQLLVIDAPKGVRVFPDERFVYAGTPPTQELLAFRDPVFPVRATDHRGRDVTSVLKKWDRKTVDGFAKRAWVGFAEEHWVTLDFGDRLKRLGDKDRVGLFLAGWTDYAYPESIYAAKQAGEELQAPVLERRGADGKWHKVVEAGFPAGLPRMMTLPLTAGQLGDRGHCVLRLRTNMRVYWDQVFVAPLLETPAPGKAAGAARVTALAVKKATLEAPGCMLEYTPDGKPPTVYDHDRPVAVPRPRVSGRLTRLGDVTPLLQETDDRHVVFGPGEEVTAHFDAKGLKPLPEGWTRTFVLRTWGYCKTFSPFTASGDSVGPLPFRAMRRYPYGKEEKFPHPDYDHKWNTRRIGE
jgi:hypothetical protein